MEKVRCSFRIEGQKKSSWKQRAFYIRLIFLYMSWLNNHRIWRTTSIQNLSFKLNFGMNFLTWALKWSLYYRRCSKGTTRSRTNSLKSQAGTQKEVTASDPDWTTWGNLGDQALEVTSITQVTFFNGYSGFFVVFFFDIYFYFRALFKLYRPIIYFLYHAECFNLF